MSSLLMIITFFFWLLLFYYSLLTVAGLLYRVRSKPPSQLERYPSVAILIPAHNEAVVIADTLYAMSKIKYPGDLQIYVLNDCSQDETGEIAQYYEHSYPYFHHVHVPPGEPRGKARVLNYGISVTESDYICVYDADNQPEPESVRLLVEAAETVPGAVGAVGYVKTMNESANWLTRMIALEFSTFQLLMQSGRWMLFQLGSLTGTNMLVKRRDLLDAGGYDPYALAEDADLTVTLTERGGLLLIVPEARTWEQEPETIRVWLRQRTRWMQGNLYLLEKAMKNPCMFKGRNLFNTAQLLLVYVCFTGFLLVSDLWFLFGLFGMTDLAQAVQVPLLILWFESWLIYYVQLVSAQMVDKVIRPLDLLVSFVMYFSYSQLWLFILLRALYFQIKLKRTKKAPVWDKTDRFQQAGQQDKSSRMRLLP
ncbi:glycosyltransferase [Brevibacillus humidisoli]|uniref:glycosyltransferase family 2 protein n=1 Tax=Brevibacillus humidisoli TaxID=2895522 RepID=UPI001E48E5AC|nr:glycosyltransferase [Brevibacillus humidisoli]UFJ41140.1 glycosyltransferase [Brevibacillus humidisoli]